MVVTKSPISFVTLKLYIMAGFRSFRKVRCTVHLRVFPFVIHICWRARQAARAHIQPRDSVLFNCLDQLLESLLDLGPYEVTLLNIVFRKYGHGNRDDQSIKWSCCRCVQDMGLEHHVVHSLLYYIFKFIALHILCDGTVHDCAYYYHHYTVRDWFRTSSCVVQGSPDLNLYNIRRLAFWLPIVSFSWTEETDFLSQVLEAGRSSNTTKSARGSNVFFHLHSASMQSHPVTNLPNIEVHLSDFRRRERGLRRQPLVGLWGQYVPHHLLL